MSGTAFPNPVCRCKHLTYTLTVTNTGAAAAEQVVITDNLPSELSGGVYSVDNGRTWQLWTGSYLAGALPAGSSISILVSGIVSPCARGCIRNTASVSANGGQSTASTVVWVSACC